jgi:hypothetical protein
MFGQLLPNKSKITTVLHSAVQWIQGGVWLPASALGQALRMREQQSVWLTYLLDQAPFMQDSPCSQAPKKRRNRAYLLGQASAMQAGRASCMRWESSGARPAPASRQPISFFAQPWCTHPGNQTPSNCMTAAWPWRACLSLCDAGWDMQATKRPLKVPISSLPPQLLVGDVSCQIKSDNIIVAGLWCPSDVSLKIIKILTVFA